MKKKFAKSSFPYRKYTFIVDNITRREFFQVYKATTKILVTNSVDDEKIVIGLPKIKSNNNNIGVLSQNSKTTDNKFFYNFDIGLSKSFTRSMLNDKPLNIYIENSPEINNLEVNQGYLNESDINYR